MIKKLLKDFKYMQIGELRSQHLDYMVKAIENCKNISVLDYSDFEIIHRFIPKLINVIDADLHRFSFRNIISIISSFQNIYNTSKLLDSDDMATLHRMTNKYIIEYLSQRKKEINGAEYADMVSILKNAIDGGFIKIYENRLLERIIQIFLKDHKDLYFFTTND